ncbi:sodium ion-translocating decarboxylase subunit beta [Paramaledivibacter caminithermalis]|jgi:Na+-transporting methylmalonyl-CoA/oxaloacetate decarboxylase beta subunit|uniref:Na+-transporting oxaloacetate decarboxylase beta subunit n=1 Tax=Paramaledivibacter caminithermalis (strain DSM 15212 / CIP 107654 / DViRD3) TaxID=1121301 RepID=A0A1M6PGH5_PARC5|nr:sodium ion-translocating decarboxylase subunit beta [Paramaledivibacter caminithermalis]SHK06987.1 Na+-transporting oxaloacetate decarboxylase beta subunit [Paramaledivibacter caminithermalis DSM 15212]
MKKILIYVAFLFLSIFIFKFFFDYHNQSVASIGIIGGADGPTKIFLASSQGTSHAVFLSIIFLIGLIIFFSFRKRFRK